MNDLTILYPTANLIPVNTAVAIANHLVRVTADKYPIISISQKPIIFGKNICVGEIGASPYNYYKQILIGTQNSTTDFVAICEDDTLYPSEHFLHRPQRDYAYNTNAWLGGAKTFWQSSNMNSFGFYICRRKALIKLLENRFSIWKEAPPSNKQRHFHEPGVWNHDLPVKVDTFFTNTPIIAFEHRGTLSGKRKRFGNNGVSSLEPFGEAKALYKEYGFESIR